MKKPNFLKLAKASAKIADDKKGIDINVLNVRKLTAISDYFVLVTANSTPHMNAIYSAIYKTFREKESLYPIHRDGFNSQNWIILDYGGLVVHILSEYAREYYPLEKLWHGARKIKY